MPPGPVAKGGGWSGELLGRVQSEELGRCKAELLMQEEEVNDLYVHLSDCRKEYKECTPQLEENKLFNGELNEWLKIKFKSN